MSSMSWGEVEVADCAFLRQGAKGQEAIRAMDMAIVDDVIDFAQSHRHLECGGGVDYLAVLQFGIDLADELDVLP